MRRIGARLPLLDGLFMAWWAAVAVIASLPAQAEEDALSPELLVQMQAEPFAILEMLDPPILHVEIPSGSNSTPAARFEITGNAVATVTATPGDFLEVPGVGILGRAVLGQGEIGYDIQVKFPLTGAPGSNAQLERLPRDAAAGTSPLSVDMAVTGGVRQGEIRLKADPAWTTHGGIPLPGIYQGEVTITVTADNL